MTTYTIMHIPSIESLLKKYQIRPKKYMGQNFLKAVPTLEKIVRLAEISKDDDVLEIGSGLGVMTALLADQAHLVYAVEKDRAAAQIIQEEFGNLKNIQLIVDDFLKLDLQQNLAQARTPLKVVGNIPYNISTPIIFKLIENKNLIQQSILTIQKEVANRIVAKPNCKDYGILSIMLQVHAKCEKLFDVSPNSFIPPPKVTSSVIKIDFENAPNLEIKSMASFENLVKAAFGQRRKTIKNALTGSPKLKCNSSQVSELLKQNNIKESLRPEQITIEEYIGLANSLNF
ncbi:MAG: 16S rRNA (adenine(1518)-N(6)/adenine(1519)-N(6))-dimethyltransferase RsmA [Pseudomonadota bacterium]